MTSSPDLALVTKSATRTAANGALTFGFVSSTDPGLSLSEFVMVPHGSTRASHGARPSAVPDNGFASAFRDCLLSDALTVNSLHIPDALKPFVAANRAYCFAAGYLGDESVEEAAPTDDAIKNQVVTACPHVSVAANINPQIGTLGIFFCTMNYYTSNHNTTGAHLPKGQIKVLKTVIPNIETLTSDQITRAVYLAGHHADKRLTLKSCLETSIVNKLQAVDSYRAVTIAETDAWAAMRVGGEMAPAGTAVLGLLKVVLNEVAKLGLLGIAPAPQAIADLAAGVSTFRRHPEAYHPGARHLFGIDPISLADVENLKVHLATFGGFCLAAGLAVSVTSSPHIKKLIEEKKDSFWFGLGKRFAKGVSASEDVVMSAMSAMGTSFGTNVPNPVVDAAGYKVSVDALAAVLHGISMNVAMTSPTASAGASGGTANP